MVVIGIISTLLLATYKRNSIWGNEMVLCQDTVKKSPGKARPHNNLGYAYMKVGRLEEALEEFKTAVRIEPNFAEAQNNIGYLYMKMGQLQEALEVSSDRYKNKARSCKST